MSSPDARLLDIDFEPNLELPEGVEDPKPIKLSEVVTEPPRQKTRDTVIHTDLTPGQISAALSRGGDVYDVRKDRRVDIILEESEHIPPTGQFLSVNGFAVLLRPGVRASVPMAFIEVLNNAIQDVPIQDGDQIIGYKQVLRFPYRVVLRK